MNNDKHYLGIDEPYELKKIISVAELDKEIAMAIVETGVTLFPEKNGDSYEFVGFAGNTTQILLLDISNSFRVKVINNAELISGDDYFAVYDVMPYTETRNVYNKGLAVKTKSGELWSGDYLQEYLFRELPMNYMIPICSHVEEQVRQYIEQIREKLKSGEQCQYTQK